MPENDVRAARTVWIAVNNSINRGACYAAVDEVSKMDKRSNRQMIADLVQNDIKENNGIFPEKNAFIERK